MGEVTDDAGTRPEENSGTGGNDFCGGKGMTIRGRCVHQSQTLRGHVAGSVVGESFDRVADDLHLSLARDQRVAEESAGVCADLHITASFEVGLRAVRAEFGLEQSQPNHLGIVQGQSGGRCRGRI